MAEGKDSVQAHANAFSFLEKRERIELASRYDQRRDSLFGLTDGFSISGPAFRLDLRGGRKPRMEGALSMKEA